MNVKNLNPLERHVEKIVLAVAIAGAAYIGYLASQPITVPDQPDVTPDKVEARVTQAVNDIQEIKENVQKLGPITPKIHNYFGDYKKSVEGSPVPEPLVDATLPQFGPKNVPVERMNGTSSHAPDGYQIVTPTVPAPADVSTVADLFNVVDLGPIDPTTGLPTPNPSGSTHVVTLVDVSGTIGLGDFISQMNNPALKPNQKLPPNQQRTVVYRIEVQRRQRVGGSWTNWQAVPASKVAGDLPDINWVNLPDAALDPTITQIDSMFQRIVEPPFYTLPPGSPPFTPDILNTLKKRAAIAPPTAAPGTPGAAPGTTVPPGGAPAVAGRLPTAVPPPPQPSDDEGNPNPSANLTPDVAAMKALPNVPFWFFDETAEGGQEYQYEVRLAMVNPTYRSPLGLANPQEANEPLLYSPWTIVAQPVIVPSDQYFFFSAGLGTKVGQSASMEIFKWIGGNWYEKGRTIQIGDEVEANVTTPNVVPSSVDVDMHYTLVDVNAVANAAGGGDVEAILLSADGQLVRRSAQLDDWRSNSLHKHLIDSLWHPAVQAPATQNGGGGSSDTGGTTPTPRPTPRSNPGGGE